MQKRVRLLGMTMLVMASMVVVLIPRATAADDAFDSMLRHDFEFAAGQSTATTAKISATRYPSTTTEATSGIWNTTDAGGWTSGFFPGILWLLYEQTGDPAWRAKAEQWQAGLKGQATDTSTHDVGFMIFTSFGNGYRLTTNDAYRQVVLTAAGSLAKRYDPEVGSIRSWGDITLTTDFEVIIDNMMNLELLFWAARNGGQRAWYDMALSHALRTRQDHVRADGSTYQVVNYDPTTGAVKGKRAHQGYNVESTWSRGQAWAIYGFATSYRETGDGRLLETAQRAADYFLAHLPADGVPYWDFEVPGLPGIPEEPRDSSAAAIAAAGLVELSKHEPDSTRKARYLDAARQILDSLSSMAYLAEGTASTAILLHGTQNKPDGKYDKGLIYGDYYFLEALLRYQAVTSSGPTPTTGAPATFTATTPASSTATATRTATATATRTATATSGATATPMSGTRIKDMTFEGGLTHPSSGADRVNGAVALESSAPLYGNNAARIPNAGDVYVEENITAASDLYVSFYVRLAALPTSDARILQTTYSGTTVGNFALRPNGALRLRYGSTTIGADSIPLTAGRVYRVGIHQKKGNGSDAVLEGYLAEGDAPFGTPFAATTSGTWTTLADRVRIGSTNPSLLDATFDDITIDTASMPGPSTVAPPAPANTPTPTNTATATPTKTATPIPTNTATAIPTNTAPAAATATATNTATSTSTATPMPTETATSTPINTATSTPTNTAMPMDTATATRTPANTVTPPAGPGNLRATAGSRSITLEWADNADNETGFSIERSTKATTGFSQIATVGANVTSFQNIGLAGGKTYYYRVRAMNGGGNSAYSNTVSATTPRN